MVSICVCFLFLLFFDIFLLFDGSLALLCKISDGCGKESIAGNFTVLIVITLYGQKKWGTHLLIFEFRCFQFHCHKCRDQAPSHAVCLYKHLWKKVVLQRATIAACRYVTESTEAWPWSVRPVTEQAFWVPRFIVYKWDHEIGFHGLAVGVGVMCKWSSTFVHIMYICNLSLKN